MTSTVACLDWLEVNSLPLSQAMQLLLGYEGQFAIPLVVPVYFFLFATQERAFNVGY